MATKSCGIWDPASKVSQAWPYEEKGNMNNLHPRRPSTANRHEPMMI